jgi:hypothetical protein
MLSVQKTRSKKENDETFDHIFNPIKNLEKNFGESLMIENQFDSIGQWVEPPSIRSFKNFGQTCRGAGNGFEVSTGNEKIPNLVHPFLLVEDVPREHRRKPGKRNL